MSVSIMRLSVSVLALVLLSGPAFAQSADEAAPLSQDDASPSTPPTSDQPDEEPTDPITALGELRRAVRHVPSDINLRLKLSQSLLQVGDLESAIEECRTTISLHPTNGKAHLQLGLTFMAKHDWRAGAAALKEALRLEPDLAHAHYSLGNIQYSLGNTKAAIQSFRQSIELQPYFPDAHYRMALLLKVSGQQREALQHMEAAAVGGVPQARLFLGNAHKNGQGVEKNLGLAIFWWVQAAELGQPTASESLTKLRRQLLAPELSVPRRAELHRAFRVYRGRLWDDFPEYQWTSEQQSLGKVLLEQHRVAEAVPILLKECYALNDEAQSELATLYEAGWEQQLPPFDKKILTCFETTAAEGYVPSRKTLVRIYATGLGVEVDLAKAKATLKGLPKLESLSLSEELGLQ